MRPDGLPRRTVADELEQALLGPGRRARDGQLERGRGDRPPRVRDCAADEHRGDERTRRRWPRHDARARAGGAEPIMARRWSTPSRSSSCTRACCVALRSGAAPWFADVLRDYDEIGDLTDRGRRKMPAMMRGADGRHLTLTRRQVAIDPGAGPRAGVPRREEGDRREHRAAQPDRPAAPPGRRQPAEHAARLGDLQLLPRTRVRLPQRLAAGLRGHRDARGQRFTSSRAQGELSRAGGPAG